MKKNLYLFIIMMNLFTVISVLAAPDEPVTTKATVSAADFEGLQPEVRIGSEIYIRFEKRMEGNNWKQLTYVADHSGELQDLSLVENDLAIIDWSREAGLDESRYVDSSTGAALLEGCKKFYEKAKLPPLTVESGSTTAEVTKIISRFTNATAMYETVMFTASSGALNGFQNDAVAVREITKDHGVVVPLKMFLFDPPGPGKGSYRLANKGGKLIALVEKDGGWYIPATDYHMPVPAN